VVRVDERLGLEACSGGPLEGRVVHDHALIHRHGPHLNAEHRNLILSPQLLSSNEFRPGAVGAEGQIAGRDFLPAITAHAAREDTDADG
jgi:hypothetical protein